MDEAKTVSSATDYYPFGMTANAYTPNGYRYGFNGKERDVGFTGDNYDFRTRIYDARMGRFFSVDPLQTKFADVTSYHFAELNTISKIEVNGNMHYLFISS